jgi:hypothetical protein
LRLGGAPLGERQFLAEICPFGLLREPSDCDQNPNFN